MNDDGVEVLFLNKYLYLLAAEHSKCVKNGGADRLWKFALELEQFKQILDDNILETVVHYDKTLFQDGIEGMLSTSDGSDIGKHTSSLVYNLLLSIIQYTDQIQRQHYFHALVNQYYKYLKHHLRNNGLKIDEILSKEKFEGQIKKLLPYAKLENLTNLWNTFDTNKGEILTTVSELNEHFLYPNVSREDCYMILRNKLGTSNYQFMNFHIKELDNRPGFLGDYFRLNITVNHDNNWQVVHLFAKYLPTTNEILRMMASASFKKEMFFYQVVIPQLKVLGCDNILDMAPNCYFARSNDVIIMEDISYQGYKSSEMTTSMSYELLQLVVKKLSNFHACGVVFEQKMSEKLGRPVTLGKDYGEYLQEIVFLKDSPNSNIMNISMRTIVDYLVPQCKDLVKDITLEDFLGRVRVSSDDIYEMVKSSDTFRNFIGHGDLWGGNILFTEDETGRPTSICLIDYQLLRYCAPQVDLLFVLYTNTTKPVRDEHMTKLLDLYYQELANNLEVNGIDLADILDRDTFWRHVEDMKAAAVCMSLCYTQVLCISKESIHDIGDDEKLDRFSKEDRREFLDGFWNRDKTYRTRIRGYVQDLYDILVR